VIRLRREGRLPAVLYGGEEKETLALSVNKHDFLRAVQAGERILVLKLADRQAQVLIKAVQSDHLGEEVLHVDFNALRAGERIRVRIPITLKGVAKGQADGGVVSQPLHHLEVECLPTAIPERVTVDVEPLLKGDDIRVGDLKLPEGVTAITRKTDVVAQCTEPKLEVVAATPTEGVAAEPEVLAEKKPEEGEEEAAAGEKGGAEAKKKEGKGS